MIFIVFFAVLNPPPIHHKLCFSPRLLLCPVQQLPDLAQVCIQRNYLQLESFRYSKRFAHMAVNFLWHFKQPCMNSILPSTLHQRRQCSPLPPCLSSWHLFKQAAFNDDPLFESLHKNISYTTLNVYHTIIFQLSWLLCLQWGKHSNKSNFRNIS